MSRLNPISLNELRSFADSQQKAKELRAFLMSLTLMYEAIESNIKIINDLELRIKQLEEDKNA